MAVRIKCKLFRFQNSPLKALLRTSVSFHSSANNLYCAREKPERKAKKYTDTVNLPQTNFPLRLDSQKRIDRDNFINKVLIPASIFFIVVFMLYFQNLA